MNQATIEKAAKTLAEQFDYPWDHMPEQGRDNMRRIAGMVIADAVAENTERCAKVCDEIADDKWNLYKGRPPYNGSEAGRADPHVQGENCGAELCACAIREGVNHAE